MSPRVLMMSLFVLVGCAAVGPDHEAPERALPGAFREAGDPSYLGDEAELAGWWARLEDPVLDGLVEEALRRSLDLREALSRVREARALRGIEDSGRFPTLDLDASLRRRGESENTPLGLFAPDSTFYSLGLESSWEVDLWGRVRRAVEAADADLQATEEDARDAAVLVAAEVARSYVELRAFQARREVARQNLSLQEQTLRLVRSRQEAGLVGQSDVAQAATNVATTRSRLPAFEIGVREAENRLAVLLGRVPGELDDRLGELRPIPRPPESIAIGVPADLLRRRADVRAAERRLAAEVARIGVAQAELYPQLRLAGNLGLISVSSGDLLEGDSNVFEIGPSLRWNLFDAGRLRQRRVAQEARAEAALVRWERAVLEAVEESENAMSSLRREQLRRVSLAEAASESRRAVELARIQYSEGLSDFQAVLDSERALALLEDDLAVSDAAIATSLIALYKALGGGFEHDPLAGAATAPS